MRRGCLAADTIEIWIEQAQDSLPRLFSFGGDIMAWKRLTPEEKDEYKAKKKEQIGELFRQIDEGVRRVFQSEQYKGYLRVMSQFTNYSFGNCMLIMMQMPYASLIAGYGKWKELGRQVNKGEKGIHIIAPMPYTEENENGEEIKRIRFKAATVFDISQTSGEPLPDYIHDLEGDIVPEQVAAVIEALRKVTGVPITFEDISGSAHGYYSQSEKRIVIRTDMSDAQTVKTAIHEAAHCLLHDKDSELETAQSSRNSKEIQAESIAFIVASRLGLDTSAYSFPYIAGWSDGKPLDALNRFLSEIQTAARKMSDAITVALHEIEQTEETAEREDESLAVGGFAM